MVIISSSRPCVTATLAPRGRPALVFRQERESSARIRALPFFRRRLRISLLSRSEPEKSGLALAALFLGGCAVYAEPALHGFGRREYPRTSRRRLNARERRTRR